MIGYFSQGKNVEPPSTPGSADDSTLYSEQSTAPDSDTDPAPIMNWNLVKSSLADKISPDTLESAFR